MTQLRILTGVHAGVTLTLSPGLHRIDSTDDADLQITDWTHEPIGLSVDDDGVVKVSSIGSTASASNDPSCVLDVWHPRTFGLTALCIGPTDKAWPSDMELMAKLFVAPQSAVRQGLVAGWRMAVLGLSALMAIGVWALPRGGTEAGSAARASRAASLGASDEQYRALADRVQSALRQQGLKGLNVRVATSTLTVRGVVEAASQRALVQQVLDEFVDRSSSVVHVTVAADVARVIADAAGGASIQVKHAGEGVFVVSGRTPDLAQLRERVKQVVTDLADQVKRVDIDVTEPPKRIEIAPAAAVMLGNNFQYVESPDGVRHFSSTKPMARDAQGNLPPQAGQPFSARNP
jgi:type III secretion protein D